MAYSPTKSVPIMPRPSHPRRPVRRRRRRQAFASASMHAAATGVRDRAPPCGARRHHPANLSLQARRRTRRAAPHQPDAHGRRQAAAGDRGLSALPVHLPRQPRHPAHQQRLRTSAAALRRLPQGHQRLPLGMGRRLLRRHPLRHRNRPSQSHRRSRRHPGNPERLAARRNAGAIDNQPKGVSNYHRIGTRVAQCGIAKPHQRCPCRQRRCCACLPALRWPHDHHRDLQTWLDPPTSTDRPNGRRQDRYLMRTAALLRRQPAELADRRSSIGRHSARLNLPDRHQIEPATAILNQHRNHHLALLRPGRHVIDRVKSRQAQPPRLPHRSNPHSGARGSSSTIIDRGFVPWRLSDAGPTARGSVTQGRHPKPALISTDRACWRRVRFTSDNVQWGGAAAWHAGYK